MAPEAAHAKGTFSTQRTDMWWLEPFLFLVALGGFVVYSMWRVFEANDPAQRFFEAASDPATGAGYHYLSPFGSPDLSVYLPASALALPVLGVFLANPSFLILPIPAGFRFTCYYFRRAYYRAFTARPADCGTEAFVGARYRGETRTMVVNNLHRYFLYLAILKMLFDAWHVVTAFYHDGHVYLGLGVAMLLVDISLLAFYVFGCHALRHLVGGRLDCYSCDAITMRQFSMRKAVDVLNRRHGLWAMTSLFWVALTDLYVRYLAMHGNPATFFGVPA